MISTLIIVPNKKSRLVRRIPNIFGCTVSICDKLNCLLWSLQKVVFLMEVTVECKVCHTLDYYHGIVCYIAIFHESLIYTYPRITAFSTKNVVKSLKMIIKWAQPIRVIISGNKAQNNPEDNKNVLFYSMSCFIDGDIACQQHSVTNF